MAAEDNMRALSSCWLSGPFGEYDPCDAACAGRKGQARAYRLLAPSPVLCGLRPGAALGSGAFGMVIKVEDLTTGVVHAMKTVAMEPEANTGHVKLSSFPFMEIEVLSRVVSCHVPFLVEVISATQCSDLTLPDSGQPGLEPIGIILSQAERSLANRIEDAATPLTGRQLARLIYSMMMSVFALHSCDILHLDIKPSNFLCHRGCGSVALADFGLSAHLARGSAAFQLTGLRGSKSYLAPEASQQRLFSKEGDVFALGVSIAELVLKGDVASSGQPGAAAFGSRFANPALMVFFARLLKGDSRDLGAYLERGFSRFAQEGLDPAEVSQMLAFVAGFCAEDPARRPSLITALNLDIFQGEWNRDPGATVEMVFPTIAPAPPEAAAPQTGWLGSALVALRWEVAAWGKMSEFASATPAGLAVFLDLYRRMLDALAQRGAFVWERYRGQIFRMENLASWARVFALAAIGQCFPQAGLKALAARVQAGRFAFRGLQESELCVALAQLCDFVFLDLRVAAALRDSYDFVAFWPLALSPRYPELRGQLPAAIDAFRQKLELPPAESGAPASSALQVGVVQPFAREPFGPNFSAIDAFAEVARRGGLLA